MSELTRENLGFQLAKASQRWNELLADGFAREGFREVRPSYGSVLLPLFEEDGLRMGEITARSHLSKQTMTTLVRLTDRDGLTERSPDPQDGRATLVQLSRRGQAFRPAAERVLAELDKLAVEQVGARRLREVARALRLLAELSPAQETAA